MEYNIFNSFIWKSKISYEKKDELIKYIEEKYIKNPNQTPKKWKCNVHSSFEEKKSFPENFESSLLDEIEKKLKEFLKIYGKKIKCKGDYFINNVWYNVYAGNHFQEPHNHGDSFFSGCYYLKFNKKIHHQTEFYNPNFNLNYSKLKDNEYFALTLDLEEDDVIIFPSFLKHGTKGMINKNNYEETRITISFNITVFDLCIKNKSKDFFSYV